MDQIVDEITERLGLPLPASANKLEVDVTRIRDALSMIDARLAAAADSAAVAAALAALQQTLNAVKAASVTRVNNYQGPEITLRREDLQLGPANGESAEAYTYDGAGRVTGIAATLDGNAANTVIGYNANGSVATITATYKGRKRVQTYAYNADGSVKTMTATEAAA